MHSHTMRTARGALERAIEILSVLGASPAGLEPANVAVRLGVPLSTVYRILRVLRRRGLVEPTGDGNGYRLGAVFIQWGTTAERGFGLVERAAAGLSRLAEATGETAQLTLLSGSLAVTVDLVESPSPLRVAPSRGRAVPLHCGAAAKAILAFLPESQWHRLASEPLARMTARTLAEPRRLVQDLRVTRRRGYAVSEEEVYEGATAVAAPIRDARGQAYASLAISGPLHRLHGVRLKRAVALVLAEAAALGQAPGTPSPATTRRSG
jgi:IclR family transcriptional regulator, acetate operon repressor